MRTPAVFCGVFLCKDVTDKWRSQDICGQKWFVYNIVTTFFEKVWYDKNRILCEGADALELQ